jgi:hypothetical protein
MYEEVVPSNIEDAPKENGPIQTVENEPVEMNEEKREKMLEYLRGCSDGAVGKDIELATADEVVLAEKLMSLKNEPDGLRQVQGEVGYYTYDDSNYIPDAALRDEKMKEVGLNKDEVEIIKQDFRLSPGGTLFKAINLVRVEKQKIKLDEDPESDRFTFDIVKRDIPGGVLFFGKVGMENGNPKYVKIDGKDREVLEKYLASKGK